MSIIDILSSKLMPSTPQHLTSQTGFQPSKDRVEETKRSRKIRQNQKTIEIDGEY